MLLKLSAHISECLEKARLSRERAENEADPFRKEEYREMERNWLLLAESYRTVERADDFIAQAEQWRHTGPQASDAEIERLAERVTGHTKKL